MKNILINSLNGFAVSDIPMFIFQLLVAALLVRVAQLVWLKRFEVDKSSSLVVIALSFTFMTILAKFSLPFAVMALAIILWMGKSENQSESSKLLRLVVGVIGIGAGFNVVLTLIITLIILVVIWFFPNKKNA